MEIDLTGLLTRYRREAALTKWAGKVVEVLENQRAGDFGRRTEIANFKIFAKIHIGA